MELRRAGVAAPILVLSPVPVAAYPFLHRYRLVPAVSGLDQLAALDAHARGAGWRVPVHLKFDTGMTRLGITPEAAGEAFARVRSSPALELAGVMSHLAEAETPESPANREQEIRFEQVLAALPGEEREGVPVHFANSAAAPLPAAEAPRPGAAGLALFGIDPARRARAASSSRCCRWWRGSSRSSPPRRTPGSATAAAGSRRGRAGSRSFRSAYADGYSWRLSNRGEAIVAGRRVPVVGRSPMDMLALDVTDAGADVGDEVVLVGRRGEVEVSIAELAAAAGTLPYELLCLFGLRLPRVVRRSAAADSARPDARQPAADRVAG